ncbi:hypothetical protein FB45DRAFT_869428 [Roridomyces roridus]|uniref:Uncharacterized protein n=1 Tax=Roridomyces roridus TaxID=1738132 RepID=A0AAD7BLI2_9AGAR|nr:hypothetical protein FB45DRAFT_869424 [Roridomyces roridus]KAJ7624511.1 hypothetical protein FB45DRAFT_869428 [Roridomyces roridus]
MAAATCRSQLLMCPSSLARMPSVRHGIGKGDALVAAPECGGIFLCAVIRAIPLEFELAPIYVPNPPNPLGQGLQHQTFRHISKQGPRMPQSGTGAGVMGSQFGRRITSAIPGNLKVGI